MYVDYFCVSMSQRLTFTAVEKLLINAVNGLPHYNAEKFFRANPFKNQVCFFHLKNSEANRRLNII